MKIKSQFKLTAGLLIIAIGRVGGIILATTTLITDNYIYVVASPLAFFLIPIIPFYIFRK